MYVCMYVCMYYRQRIHTKINSGIFPFFFCYSSSQPPAAGLFIRPFFHASHCLTGGLFLGTPIL